MIDRPHFGVLRDKSGLHYIHVYVYPYIVMKYFLCMLGPGPICMNNLTYLSALIFKFDTDILVNTSNF